MPSVFQGSLKKLVWDLCKTSDLGTTQNNSIAECADNYEEMCQRWGVLQRFQLSSKRTLYLIGKIMQRRFVGWAFMPTRPRPKAA